jgi:hypothetical protein
MSGRDLARIVERFAVGLLAIAVLARGLPMSPASRIADDLAVAVNAAVVLAAAIYGRHEQREQTAPSPAQRTKNNKKG